MSDRLLLWKDSKQMFYGDLNDITITNDEPAALSLKCTTQTITLWWKDNNAKEDFLTLLKTAKKAKKEKDNQIERAVFILPRDGVVEKMPLLGEVPNQEEATPSCCFTIL